MMFKNNFLRVLILLNLISFDKYAVCDNSINNNDTNLNNKIELIDINENNLLENNNNNEDEIDLQNNENDFYQKFMEIIFVLFQEVIVEKKLESKINQENFQKIIYEFIFEDMSSEDKLIEKLMDSIKNTSKIFSRYQSIENDQNIYLIKTYPLFCGLSISTVLNMFINFINNKENDGIFNKCMSGLNKLLNIANIGVSLFAMKTIYDINVFRKSQLKVLSEIDQFNDKDSGLKDAIKNKIVKKIDSFIK